MRQRMRWSAEEILEALRAVVAERGENVSQLEFCRAVGIGQATVLRRCGGWVELKRAAGLTPQRKRPPKCHSREGLRDALVRLAAEQGGRVTLFGFCRALGISSATVERYWGSWTALQQAAGVPRNCRRSRWSDEDLLREYARVIRLAGKLPTAAEFDLYGRCSSHTLLVRFGGQRGLKERFARFVLAHRLGTAGRTLSDEEMRRVMQTIPAADGAGHR